ncbi:MAG: hypothetical protein ACE19M_00635 [Candidatus Karelsulcia muelleri]
MASSLKADLLEICTNVNVIRTANTKLVSQAYTIRNISYEEAIELSHFVAKRISPTTIKPVREKNITIKIKSIFEKKTKETSIERINCFKTKPVTGIYGIKQISLITLEGSGMVGITGFYKRLLKQLSEEKIKGIFITQSSSEYSIAVGINEKDCLKAKLVIDNEFYIEISNKKRKHILKKQ